MKKRVLSSILAGVLAVSVFAEAKQKTTARQQITAQHLQQKQPQKSLQKQQAAQ